MTFFLGAEGFSIAAEELCWGAEGFLGCSRIFWELKNFFRALWNFSCAEQFSWGAEEFFWGTGEFSCMAEESFWDTEGFFVVLMDFLES